MIRLWGMGMPKAYSADLRKGVIELVEGGCSRHEAAEDFGISIASAVRWVQRWRQCRSAAPRPRGGSQSPLEKYKERLLALVAERSDLTLDEIVTAMHKRGIPGSRSAVDRFLKRHKITYKKKPARGRTTARRRGAGASALAPRARAA